MLGTLKKKVLYTKFHPNMIIMGFLNVVEVGQMF